MIAGILLAAVVAAAPPQRLADVWNTERGLPQNTVNAIVQTRHEHLWLATFGELARLVGAGLTVFTAATCRATIDSNGLLAYVRSAIHGECSNSAPQTPTKPA